MSATEALVEVERRFELDFESPLPDLSRADGIDAVGPVTVKVLDAVYYDTAERDLTRRGVELRRRTGGSEAGWHVKRPTGNGPDARLEIQVPLDEAASDPDRSPADGGSVAPGSEVPADLLAQVAAQARGRVVEPIAHIRTIRREAPLLDASGTHLASVADDLVEAQPLGTGPGGELRWRELEVELVDGDEPLLDAVARALHEGAVEASAWPSKVAHVVGGQIESDANHRGVDRAGRSGRRRRTTASEVVMTHLAVEVERLVGLDPAARTDESDAVHQMRVATRRLRSALATFRPLFDRSVTDPIRAELRWLGAALGRARDAEVMRTRLVEDAQALPPDLALGPVAVIIEREMHRRHADARAGVDRALSTGRYFALLDDLERLISDPPLRPDQDGKARKRLPRLVRRACRRIDRAGAALDDARPADRDDQLHELRKAAKRARYAAESVEPVFGRSADRLAARFEDLQDLLGEHQDSVGARGAAASDRGERPPLGPERLQLRPHARSRVGAERAGAVRPGPCSHAAPGSVGSATSDRRPREVCRRSRRGMIPPVRLLPGRPGRFHALVVVGPVLAICAAAWVSAHPARASARDRAQPSADVASTYLASCAVCHGPRGEGSDRGPAIVDSGSALVDYMLSTGRMPISEPTSSIERHVPAFDAETQAALVAYIAGFGGDGPGIPSVDPDRGDPARGGEIFRLNCAACHSAAGSGGALLDEAAPDLRRSTPTQVAEAIRGGPSPMPKFGTAALDDQQVDDVAAYVRTLQPPDHRGGVGLDYLGPFSEGAVAWVFGLGAMIVAVILIERRRT